LAPKNKNFTALHFFTGTPDPSKSCFKPFVFPNGSFQISQQVLSPKYADFEHPEKVCVSNFLFIQLGFS